MSRERYFRTYVDAHEHVGVLEGVRLTRLEINLLGTAFIDGLATAWPKRLAKAFDCK